MNSGEDDTIDRQVRSPKSQRWIQFYVDLFLANGPKHCKEMSLIVIPDFQRRNGCNWQVSVNFPEDKADHECHCLQFIEDDLRLLFSVFDLEAEEGEASGVLGLKFA